MGNIGRHQWTVVVSYGVTDAEARAIKTVPGHDQRLDAEHRLSIDGPGCVNCEEPWTPELAARPCPMEWYDMTPRPMRVRQT